MKKILAVFAVFVLVAGTAMAVHAQMETKPPAAPPAATAPVAATPPTPSAAPALNSPATTVPERSLGRADAPVVIEEFVSLTCPHCAEFYKDVLPKIEERYIATGKVRIIMRDFPSDGPGLRAGSLARCMPEDEFFPFIKVLYNNQATWATSPTPEQYLIQYAKLGGLSEDKAKECLNDTKLQGAIVDLRNTLETKYSIEATPELVFNGGAQKLAGVRSVEEFAAVADKLLPAPPSVPPSTPEKH